MVWAGASEHSGLATILSAVRWAVFAISTLALVLFPAVYRAIGESLLPSDTDADLTGWRILVLAGVVVGSLMLSLGHQADFLANLSSVEK